VCYFHEFRDELRADWLAKYGDPAVTMHAESLSDKECRPLYSGLNGFSDVSASDYLTGMVSEESVTFTVRHQIGGQVKPKHATTRAAPDGFAQAGLDMWAMQNPAAASRRRNPYVQAKKYFEYEETIDPETMARSVMTTRVQLANEFKRDVLALKNRPDPKEPLHLYESGVEATPLRHENADLCERLATREAAIYYGIVSKSIPHAKFVRQMLETPIPTDLYKDDEHEATAEEEANTNNAWGEHQRDTLGDHTRLPGTSEKWLANVRRREAFYGQGGASGRIEPKAIAANIEKVRLNIYDSWTTRIDDFVTSEHICVDRLTLEDLFRQSVRGHPGYAEALEAIYGKERSLFDFSRQPQEDSQRGEESHATESRLFL